MLLIELFNIFYRKEVWRTIKLDYSSFFYSIAGCSATIIAIIGGFIAAKLISISADRENILDKIKEINDELNIKMKQHDNITEQLDDDDALDFVRDNVSELVDRRSIDIVYKPEEKPRLDYSKMEKYWLRALKICEEIINLGDERASNVNSDKVPVILAKKYINEFDYGVCKKVLVEIKKREKNSAYLSSLLFDTEDFIPQTAPFWYHEKEGEVEKLEMRIQELKFEKSQYEEKKRKIRKPKGMKSGLIIFIIFSFLGVFFPLLCALMNKIYNNCSQYMPIISLSLFAICVLITFIYLVLLLRWKNFDNEGNR